MFPLALYFSYQKEEHILDLLPPLAQACSLCPIQNSQFSPPPIRPIYPTCRTFYVNIQILKGIF